ncbi:Zn-ribbon domain-containing OB-fold protein [Nocardia pseudovaccinii]|uniref:Zn-ribbon domain-containing OB-fold protein n=1 Tax=Nocardia pseudovaccinii TaxID=189540 RepID=UPI003D8D47C8
MNAARLATALPSDFVAITTDSVTEPFWQAARQRRLVAPQCADCATFRLPPTPFCPECLSTAVDWPELSGRAIIYSFAVVHGFPGLPDVTLVPAVVDLPDAPGARLVTNVIDIEPEQVRIGMELIVDFHPISHGWLLPVFRKAEE